MRLHLAAHLGSPPAPWLRASPWRAVLESLLLAVAISLLVPALAPPPVRIGGPPLDPTVLLLDGPFCSLWCAVRLRMGRVVWWRQMLAEGALGLGLGLAPTAVIATALLTASTTGDRIARAVRMLEGHVPLPIICALFLALFSVEFIVFRVGVRLWLVWDHLRRTRLRWALTHAHLTVVVLGAGLFGLLLFALSYVLGGGLGLNVVPLLFVLSMMSALGILLVLPPSAIFSYLFARRTTRRLQALAAATSALRAGDYAVRVPIEGEDEVAQLQTNFNAMAGELERAVRELQTERDTVAGLLRARRELVASVSHELRTPVATLRGYLESTRAHWEDTPPGSLRHDLEVMERETIQLQALIDDLFTLARAEVGKLDLRCEPTDMVRLAQRVVETIAPLAWQTNRVEVVAEEPTAPMSLARADASRLEQALRNLLHNGVRHTPPGGIVAVSVAACGETVALRVRDTGEGIAATDLPRIWDRFYRAENARAQANSGAGLGLALVKEMTEAMGGTVEVESASGAGSSFTLHLPRA